MEWIALLCESSAGLEAAAPQLCDAMRALIGCQSASIFWCDEDGVPSGYFHDCAPPEIKDIFVTRFEELFAPPDQMSMMTIVNSKGPPIGQFLDDAMLQKLWQGNVYRYLCAPLGHHFLLDMRVDFGGRGRICVALWQDKDTPFTKAQAQKLEPVRQLMQTVFTTAPDSDSWFRVSDQMAHMITDGDGKTILSSNGEALSILQKSHLMNQNISTTTISRDAPAFCADFAQLVTTKGYQISDYIAVAGGRLRIDACLSNSAFETHKQHNILMLLQLETNRELDAIKAMKDSPLTMLQKRIALYAAKGHPRHTCASHFDISEQALKKHLAHIYTALDLHSWNELQSG